MVELIVHGIVVLMVTFDVFSHYRDHRKRKNKRAASKVYTLDEARVILFNEALKHDG